uniref:Uncharacterized protein n=1 Tax=Cucumis melo TaxID=3656 RepID=A0A9I9CCW5_CUCME
MQKAFHWQAILFFKGFLVTHVILTSDISRSCHQKP